MAHRSILLLAVVFAAYSPALRGTFLWDDHGHVPDRPGFYTLFGLSQIWRQPGYTQQYYPLTFTTVWLAHHLWGAHPAGYHILAVLFHGLNAILLFLLLDGLGCPGSWWAALLFALHPVEVESVAWISEIKNTQSTFFYLSALILYLRSSADGRWKTYLWAFAIYLCALATKTVACTFPAVALVLLWYRNGRVERKEFLRLVPFFGAGVLMVFATAGFEKNILGAIGPAWEFTGLSAFFLRDGLSGFISASSSGLIRSYSITRSGTFTMWGLKALCWALAVVILFGGLWSVPTPVGEGSVRGCCGFRDSPLTRPRLCRFLSHALFLRGGPFSVSGESELDCPCRGRLVAASPWKLQPLSAFSRYRPSVRGAWRYVVAEPRMPTGLQRSCTTISWPKIPLR